MTGMSYALFTLGTLVSTTAIVKQMAILAPKIKQYKNQVRQEGNQENIDIVDEITEISEGPIPEDGDPLSISNEEF